MKRLKLIFVFSLLISVHFIYLIAKDFDTPLFKAMEDEMKRNIENLKLEKENPPYFISYRVVETERFNIISSFGAIVKEDIKNERLLFIDLRVGNYEFDNSNFVSMTEVYGNPRIVVRLPLEDNYDSIRHAIWLATDELYKGAIDTLAKKKSVMEHREIKDKIPDFTKSTPFQFSEEISKIKIDRKVWRDNLKKLSSLFRNYPKLLSSKIVLTSLSKVQYYIDSDGNKNIRNDPMISVEVYLNSMTEDGWKLKDYLAFHASSPDELPSFNEMESKIKGMAEEINLVSEASIEKEYSGPVLLLNPASCEFFYYTLAKGISDSRKPVYEQEMLKEIREENRGFLSSRFEKMVMPSSFNAWCDPSQSKWKNFPLIGRMSVDDQGVKSERINVIKNGKLVDFPMGRTPIKEKSGSNGHGRYINGNIVGFVSNLIITSDKTTETIENDFLELIKEKGLEYGLVIKKLSPPIPPTYEELIEERLFTMGKKKEILPAPLISFKLFPDGRKEYIRGLKFEGVTPTILQDIVLAGKEEGVFNLLVRDSFQELLERIVLGSPLPISIVAPPIVIDKMVLTFSEEKAEKKPYMKNPFFERESK